MSCRHAVFLTLLSSCLSASCGYRAIYGGPTAGRLHVKILRTLITDAIASDEVATGVREELARAGALAGGDGYPRVEIEVLREDEASDAIAVGPARPRARGLDIAIVARAWVTRQPGAVPENDTGDVRASELVTVDESSGAPDPSAGAFHQADALRAAAHRLGRKLARSVLFQPAASEDIAEPP